VALKLIAAAIHAQRRIRRALQREARAAGRLRHPNVVMLLILILDSGG